MNRALAIYLAAVALVSLGMYVHVVLFNLYLADLSFREDFMGRLTFSLTLGTAAGTVPAAALARRLGLRRAVLISLGGLVAALALRALLVGTGLLAASFLAGFFLAGWFVTNLPAVAGLAPKETRGRASAFSWNTALGIGVGAGGGVLAGYLPGWLGGGSPAAGKRAALLVAALLVAAGMLVIARVPFAKGLAADAGKAGAGAWSVLRRSAARAFLVRFLLAVALWYAFAAGFLPFFNVYLRNRMGASVQQIGGIFAAGQMAPAAAVLLMAPLVVRLGLLPAIVLTQVLAAACLFSLWPVHTLAPAAALYVLYLSFQVMSEPGLQNLLMSNVPAAERPAASAANLLVMFGIQALVGALAGALIVARGYPALLALLGATGLAAAALSAALLPRAFPAQSAPGSTTADSFPWHS